MSAAIGLELARRASTDGILDPDSMLGLLMLEEMGINVSRVAMKLGVEPKRVEAGMAGARDGMIGKVMHYTGERLTRAVRYSGLLAAPWKRDLIEMMLRADGASTVQVEDMMDGYGRSGPTSEAVFELRRELKEIGVGLDSEKLNAGLAHRYRITGNDAWRMQKIIANGWEL